MRGLTVICGQAAALRMAIDLVGAQAALGGPARLFLTGDVLKGLAGASAARDTGLADCVALGARVIICQSALAASGTTLEGLAEQLDTGDGPLSSGVLTGGGLIGLMNTLGEDRLLAF